MDSKNTNTKMTKRKIIGLISLMVFSLVFIFSCLKKVLPVGAWLIGTFGGLVYPMSIIFAFISLAIFLGFSYSKNPKPLALFTLATFAVLLAIHSIDTYKGLNAVVRFVDMKKYLKLSYSNTTIVGSFGSILCSLISILLGGMGTIITFVILATIFIGLFFDYELYGKYHEPHIKKLKTKKLREKVATSDKNVSSEGVPDYSFTEFNSPIGEVSVDANEYESNTSYSNVVSNYNFGETAYETQTAEVDDFGQTYREEIQTPNTFATDFYKSETIPDIYSSEMNEYRRQFMNDTFGTTSATATENDIAQAETNLSNFGVTSNTFEPTSFESLQNYEPENNDEENDIVNSLNIEGLNSFESVEDDEPSIDDAFSKFLQTDENIEENIRKDVSENSFGLNFDTNSVGGFSLGGYEESKPTYAEPAPQGNPFENINSGLYNNRFNGGFNSSPIQNMAQPSSLNSFNSKLNNVVIPAKETRPQRATSNVGMRGVRYNAPTLNLLKVPVPDTGDYTAEQNRKTMILENSLEAFKIPAKVKNIVRGPKITRYELSVPLGISVKKIPMYENDIAAALAAKTITIKAPIPGSNYVGIELENDTFTTVYQRELFESDAFQNCRDPLPIAIGKDISGEIVVKSLVDMVHLLIAGSTGSGKSVFIHNVVLSLIYKHSPDDLRLIMIDPKKVEFPIYNGLPHLLTPEVVAGAQKAIGALRWCVKEMDRRYDLMAKAGHNNIKSYNKSDLVKVGQFEKLPYIVIIVDELAEIMQADKKNAEGYIQRITQLARACGMHMVLATQRPSVDIITGVIKNNIPSRIAFSLQSGIDSKTIINTVGAEKLLGRGDMIFYPTGTSAMPRLQASYASDDEIREVIEYTIRNNDANYDEAVEKAMDQESVETDSSSGFNGGDGVPSQREAADPYFQTAVKLVMQNGGASTSYLQRRLSIGYSRAARIMDQMSDKGFIAASNGSKTRKILITPEQFKEEFGVDFDSID